MTASVSDCTGWVSGRASFQGNSILREGRVGGGVVAGLGSTCASCDSRGWDANATESWRAVLAYEGGI